MRQTAIRLCRSKKKRDPKEEWARVTDSGIWMSLSFEETYPARLSCISDKPYALYGKGHLPKDKEPSAAIVGARACTAYGEECARWFAEEMVKKRDPDHQRDGARDRRKRPESALTGGGMTYAVLGNGVDICYPREHIGLYTDILHTRRDLIGTAAEDETICMEFPRRNRIISALSDVVLVMEAKRKERFPDHCGSCAGAGKRCVCASRTGGKSFEPRVSFFDPAGSRNTDLAGRIMSGSWNCRKGGKEGKKDRNSKSA